MKLNKLYLGNCIEVMKGFPDNCIDSIVTDPPYGLEFMGKEWDKLQTAQWQNKKEKWQDNHSDNHIAQRMAKMPRYYAGKEMQNFHYQWAAECLRILKPGGHLLSFGGTRTYHRMVCGIEDAEFEIRDCIQWLYGSGFPKNLNIGKQIDKISKRIDLFKPFANHFKEQRNKKGLSRKDIAVYFPSKTGGTTGCVWNWENAANVPTLKQWKILKPILDLSNKFELLIQRIEVEREIIGKAKNQIGKYKQGSSQWVTNKGIYRDDKKLELMETIPATPEAKQWDGWGTGLKPANEPIVLARKPISEKNIAENVLKWETGGINIDGCRIEVNKDNERRYDLEKAGSKSIKLSNNYNPNIDFGQKKFKERTKTSSHFSKGRWPANVIFDKEAANLLDEQTKNKLHAAGSCSHRNFKGWENSGDLQNENIPNDSGGASRFFYVAKASKSERNAGLEGFEKKVGGGMKGTEDQTLLTGSGNIRNNLLKNNHPTVKPIKLMRYLVRLITPPGGICLDPFIGSGTTAIACIQEGFNYIGIEKEKEYFDIAKARIRCVKRRSKGFFKPNEVQSKKISRQKGFF